MSKEKFVPQGELETAIAAQEPEAIIQLAVEAWSHAGGGQALPRPDIVKSRAFARLPVRIAAVVLRCAMGYEMRKQAAALLKQNDPASKVLQLISDVEDIPHGEPDTGEEKLLEAIAGGNCREIHRLLLAGEVLRNMERARLAVFCRALLSLPRHTVVRLLAGGIQAAAVPSLLMFLLQSCEDETVLNGMDYRGRLKFTNLLIHILQGEITPDDDDLIEQDWYPEGNSIADGSDRRVYCHSYSYYYDPKHRYEPRFTGGEYESPAHPVRPSSTERGNRQ